MESRIDKTYGVTHRHAETLDTRQGIRRDDDKEHQRRQNEENGQAADDDQWRDHTIVSISALRVLLEGLIQDNSVLPPQNSQAPEPAPPVRHEALNRSSAAAYAYQRTYSATYGPAETQAGNAVATTPAAVADANPGTGTLSLDEKRRINALINDLARLARKNVTALEIFKSDSFLNSLQNAVEEAKRTHNIA